MVLNVCSLFLLSCILFFILCYTRVELFRFILCLDDEIFEKFLTDHFQMINDKLLAFKTSVIEAKFQEIAEMPATTDEKIGD